VAEDGLPDASARPCQENRVVHSIDHPGREAKKRPIRARDGDPTGLAPVFRDPGVDCAARDPLWPDPSCRRSR
jgi:hypothetical protein